MRMKVEQLHDFLANEAKQGFDLRQDSAFMQQLGDLEIQLDAYVAFEERIFASVRAGESVGDISSVLKIRRTELRQRIDELVLDAVSHYGLPYQPEVRNFEHPPEPIGSETAATATPRYLNDRAATIYAGSNEIQRNILAKRTLGL